MSYFEEIRETNSIIKKLLILVRPLGIITGGGSNRLSVDVNNVATVAAVNTVATVATVNTVTTVTGVTTVSNVANAIVSNQTNTGGVNSFAVAKDTSRLAYNTGIRSQLTFP